VSEDKGLIEHLGQALVNGQAPGALKGGVGAGLAVALLSVTHAVPEEWEHWVQWPLYVLFVVGIVRIAVAMR